MAVKPRQIMPFGIEVVGLTWHACWELENGELCVFGAYGSRTVPLGRRKPEKLAERVFREILLEWCAGREGCVVVSGRQYARNPG